MVTAPGFGNGDVVITIVAEALGRSFFFSGKTAPPDQITYRGQRLAQTF
jgi:hypothetical protein